MTLTTIPAAHVTPWNFFRGKWNDRIKKIEEKVKTPFDGEKCSYTDVTKQTIVNFLFVISIQQM
jgi:hypothetical protein